jgi:hypothetical protein
MIITLRRASSAIIYCGVEQPATTAPVPVLGSPHALSLFIRSRSRQYHQPDPLN